MAAIDSASRLAISSMRALNRSVLVVIGCSLSCSVDPSMPSDACPLHFVIANGPLVEAHDLVLQYH